MNTIMKQNINKLLCLVTLALVAFSCKKNVIEYDAQKLSGEAEFQLHYFVPVVANAPNNIYKVEINGELYANATAPLATYNAIPSGAVGRFYTTKTGQNNIKLYQSTDLNLVYDQNVELKKGKQNVFVYDFTKPPIVFDSGYPFTSEVNDSTGKEAWVRFFNFLYETEGVPTTLSLQYQYQYIVDNATGQKSDWLNVGAPVKFGEATVWQKVPVNKTVEISAGTARIDYRVRLIGPDGTDQGSLKVMNASNNFVDYSDWWNAAIGRRYMHILSGFRAAKPISAVRLFTSL